MTKYELRLINNLESEDMEIDEAEYNVTCEMSSKEFGDICKQLVTIDDKILIEADKTAINFKVNGDLGKAEIALENNVSNDQEKCINMKLADVYEATTFSLKYLILFNKCHSFSPNVTICLNADKPMIVK
mmetsp:Transcript_112367/g.242184  ORF Transcript_112367/g.242184 Transcript_112367/m.242184 type:complete len:130 (-) Transcript_112367:282-671(-)|eukprot:CAMPEP_0116898462 /NCGR_PEP_ID=MMETSP0467-20121206/7184_1 /TAXON_ID=283647 /ORGANISM="Mesodinium pulex, Strain SPMC105" /LENGTH=129 /DNA_ID=CAMNT_0004570613 /DNA_START=326 /DNA_END=715 /DNA_ORIENTATION=+